MSLYRTILGTKYSSLDADVQSLHMRANLFARGELNFKRSRSIWSRFFCWLAKLPNSSGLVKSELRVVSSDGGEVWERRFGDEVFRTWQYGYLGGLYERNAVGCIEIRLSVDKGQLVFEFARTYLLGLPLPRAFGVVGRAVESAEGRRWNVHVELRNPLVGFLLSYEGDMELVDD